MDIKYALHTYSLFMYLDHVRGDISMWFWLMSNRVWWNLQGRRYCREPCMTLKQKKIKEISHVSHFMHLWSFVFLMGAIHKKKIRNFKKKQTKEQKNPVALIPWKLHLLVHVYLFQFSSKHLHICECNKKSENQQIK